MNTDTNTDPHLLLTVNIILTRLDKVIFNKPVYLRSHHGTYLRAYSNGKVDMSPNMAEWEEWVIVPADANNKSKVGFRSCWNKFLSARVFLYEAAQAKVLNNWEKWTVKHVNDKLAFISDHKRNLRADQNGEVNQSKNLESWELWEIIPKCQ
eukprot:TRINITY_DN5100_c0_g1_i2.p1 TRINITY_DN5100_c0_g1~~TRINITY_DN5100_c0_g1_i2.p1  ORF type:complete len:152 (+),score=17.51 TRINITY_DN5100_c0_g1_i2:318-773(+)